MYRNIFGTNYFTIPGTHPSALTAKPGVAGAHQPASGTAAGARGDKHRGTSHSRQQLQGASPGQNLVWLSNFSIHFNTCRFVFRMVFSRGRRGDVYCLLFI